jgi:hypothetical protein
MEHAIKRAMHQDEVKEQKRQRKLAKGLPSTAPTPPMTNPPTPGHHTRRASDTLATPVERGALDGSATEREVIVDTEKNEVVVKRRRWFGLRRNKSAVKGEEHEKIRPNWRDTNPLPTMFSIFKSPCNSLSLFASGA